MSRLYVVDQFDAAGDPLATHVVRAGSRAQAIQHYVKTYFKAHPASLEDLERLVIGAGIKIESVLVQDEQQREPPYP